MQVVYNDLISNQNQNATASIHATIPASNILTSNARVACCLRCEAAVT